MFYLNKYYSNIHFKIIAVFMMLVISCQKSGPKGEPTLVHPPARNTAMSLSPDVIQKIIAPFNKGVTLMDQYKASEAVSAFREVTEKAPNSIAGHLNLGIALLNTQNETDLLAAENELKWVLGRDPGNPYAHYSLGMLYKHVNRYSEAQTEFEKVLESDPGDGDAHYQLAILIIDQNPEAARRHLEKTLEKIPHHEAALYRLNKLLQHAGEKSAANSVLKRYHELKSAGAGVVYGMKYGEMGRYAEVIRTLGKTDPLRLTTPLPAFRDIAGEAGLTFTSHGKPGLPGRSSRFDPGAFGPGLTLAFKKDLTATLLYITGVGADGNGLLLEYRDGKFTEVKNTGIDGRGAVGAFFGDYDRDGDADLYLTCAGPNRLYRNDSDTVFTDITLQTETAGGNVMSVGAAWADADHDGDLDLYVANYAVMGDNREIPAGAPNNLWQNNGDGTFIDIGATAGVDGDSVSTMSVLFYDLDDDRDQDLYLINDRSPNRIFFNDRVGRYTEMTRKFPLLADAGPGLGVLAGDVDQNGLADLLLLKGEGPPQLWLHTTRDIFINDTTFTDVMKDLTSTAGGLLGDLDLDGDLDLILLNSVTKSGSRRDEVLLNDGTGTFASAVQLGDSRVLHDARGALAFDFDRNGSLEVLVTNAEGPPALWETELPADRHWLEVLPVVKTDMGLVWPDASANGCAVECKADRLLQIRDLQGGSGYLGSQTELLHFGLGNQSRADYVRLTWPDALFQTESEVTANQRWEVTKIEKKPSSCPVLFSWDGNQFSFITDILGVGGVGFFIEPGLYGPPDPTEDILIPKDRILPRGGKYLFSISEPLEEVSYLDQVYLVVYDHPKNYEVYPDERFTGSPPFPTGEPRCVENKIFPVTARSSLGTDITTALHDIDRNYAEPPLDSRFVGFAKDHWVELDFGDRLTSMGGKQTILYLYGWVEYTYSHVNYAAYQAGISLQPPRIEIPDGKGGWQIVVREAGFPAGLPRMMTLDISSLPFAKTGKIRIRTNMEIYWDQIFVGVNVCDSKLRKTRLHPVRADLRRFGYPREYSPDGKNPTLYDYQRIDTGVPFKNMTGKYTRFGDVRDLLKTVDDEYVIMGHGEEIALEFPEEALPVLPENWTRTFVIHADGYCKDMDLYTAYPNTIDPLPFHKMENYPPEFSEDNDRQVRYRQKWNTRVITGY